MKLRTCPDIARWIPSRWEDFVGNKRLIDILKSLLKQLRGGNTTVRPSFLVTGESRSGKTASIKFFARCLLCRELNPESLNPCRGTCPHCREDVARYGLRGMHATVAGSDFHYLPVDCASITPAELRELLIDLWDYDGVRVVYLDEVHRLKKHAMDEQLLKPVEEKNIVWLVSTAIPGPLEGMFKKRFIKVQTVLPGKDELALWLADRCGDWGIDYDSEALILLAGRSNWIPGRALQALDLARLQEAGVTLELVEAFEFEEDG